MSEHDERNGEGNLPLQLPSHCIGIGASAGGLEALQEFFSHMDPHSGAAFMVVQHLSPDYKSMMTELLGKHTTMPIYQVTDGMLVESNAVYLIPPRKNMMLESGKLWLSEQTKDNSFHTPIDFFLRSLAADQQHKAIGIILSGTGSDGTEGIKSLKETGGLVIVQEPGSAKFDGMPVSANNTGMADVLLVPGQMGETIIKYIRHPFFSEGRSLLKDAAVEKKEVLNEIFQILKRQSSINFSLYKASTVARRIERRMSINQLTTLEAYLRLIIDSPKELQALSKELLIGVTRFFRDEEPYEILEQSVIPELIENSARNTDTVRVWTAGCSTGEEAYSIAMLLDEAAKKAKRDIVIKIFATDVDPEAIAEASAGQYGEEAMRSVSSDRISRYFEQRGDRYTISQSIRQMVIFASHNVIEDPPFSNVDLISCRNTLIYFQHAAQKKVLSTFYFSLRKNGVLFLGGSEALGELKSHFEVVDERNRLFRKQTNLKIPIGDRTAIPQSDVASRMDMAMTPVSHLLRPVKENNYNYLTAVRERLIREHAPDCIVLSESFDAVHVYGDVSAYTRSLGAGRVSNNIKDIVIDDLSVAVSTALHRAEKSEADVYYTDVLVRDTEQDHYYLDLSVLYIRTNERNTNSPHFFAVQFIRNRDRQVDEKHSIAFDVGEQSRQRIRDLESELLKEQEHLQITIEELETTNEELQSANEELMSANEELQSTNEELQSVNEELYTINYEYQEKIGELTEANNYLDSIINAAEIGMLFLDDKLVIRKFTDSITQYVNLMDTDTGRPFHHISHTLDYPELLADVSRVCETRNKLKREAMSDSGDVVAVQLIPYTTDKTSNDVGVLITLSNVTHLRNIESALSEAQQKLDQKDERGK